MILNVVKVQIILTCVKGSMRKLKTYFLMKVLSDCIIFRVVLY